MAIINELQNLGNAVRERTSTTSLLTMNEMADKVRKIPYPQTDTITITANGTYSAPTGIDGYSKVDVNVEPTLESITIIENGTYTPQENIDGYNEIIVNTPVPVDPVIQEIEIIENGTYSATDGVDGYNPIIVNVPTGGGEIPEEIFRLEGSCYYRFAYNGWYDLLQHYGEKIKAIAITDSRYMFAYSDKFVDIPITIQNSVMSMDNMFRDCYYLETLPIMTSINPEAVQAMFYGCNRLRTIPEDYFDTWDFSTVQSFSRYVNSMFRGCYSLRKIPKTILESCWSGSSSYAQSFYNGAFYECFCLDEVVDLQVAPVTYTSNAFRYTFYACHRLKEFTFLKNKDGTAQEINWTGQTIDLSSYIGYAPNRSILLSYNSGITADKEVKDDTTYQALKDDPDWFSIDKQYSRYNHNSAVNTINSLPDCSSGTNNTIKFYGESGALTDGGAINTLTEAEIAVATAKGWSVALS